MIIDHRLWSVGWKHRHGWCCKVMTLSLFYKDISTKPTNKMISIFLDWSTKPQTNKQTIKTMMDESDSNADESVLWWFKVFQDACWWNSVLRTKADWLKIDCMCTLFPHVSSDGEKPPLWFNVEIDQEGKQILHIALTTIWIIINLMMMTVVMQSC